MAGSGRAQTAPAGTTRIKGMATEQKIEEDLIARLEAQKYTYRPDIRDNAALEQNFRAKFAALNRVNLTDSEFARLINGVPVVQIELKALGLTPRRAMQQIVEYKNDPGNGYTDKLLCFIQLFIVSNRSDTLYFANNHHKHFSFDADERFLPIYRLADKNNAKMALRRRV